MSDLLKPDFFRWSDVWIDAPILKKQKTKTLNFGVSFLDEALHGISQEDLILLGAPSGAGKTQMCVEVTCSNAREGAVLSLYPLEASRHEWILRTQYKLISGQRAAHKNSIDFIKGFNYTDFVRGKYDDKLHAAQRQVNEIGDAFSNIFEYSQTKDFTVSKLQDSLIGQAPKTDLFIIDHTHYFDYDNDNENQALKKIAKTCRDLALLTETPIFLVSHLRKRDARYSEAVPSIDDFHGSSDLTKIATKVISLARAGRISNTKFLTAVRICKNREDGRVVNSVGGLIFDYEAMAYEKQYYLGHVSLKGDQIVWIKERNQLPDWAESAVPYVE